MAPAFVVVILVAAGDAGDPATKTMTATAQEALGPDAIVLVREVDAMPSDDDAVRLETTLRAEAVVEVTWPGATHDHAHLRVHAPAESSKWAERDLSFAARDLPGERGRTTGFAVASMLPTPKAASATAPSAAPRPPAASSPTLPPSSPSAASPPAASPPAAPVAPPRPRRAGDRGAELPTARAAFDVSAAGALGLGGNAAGLGGEVGARLRLSHGFSLVGFGSAMLGDMESAQATSSTLRFVAGGAFEPLRPLATRPFAIGVVLDAGASRVSLTRRIVGADPISGARWVGVSQGRLELAWWVLPQTALVSSVGVEVAFGATRVVIDDASVSSIPVVRGLASLGVRSSF